MTQTRHEEFPINKMGIKIGKANLVELCRQILSTEMNEKGEYDVSRVLTLLRARIVKYPSAQRAEINNSCIKNAAIDIREERGLIHPRMKKNYRRDNVIPKQTASTAPPHESNGKPADAKDATDETKYSLDEIDFAVRTSEGLARFGGGAGDVLRLISRLTQTKGERP
jgi:hypothetical protein